MDSKQLSKIIHQHRGFVILCALLLVFNLIAYGFFVRNGAKDISRYQEAYRTKRTELATAVQNQTQRRHRLEAIANLKAFWQLVGPKNHFPDHVRQLKRLTENRPLTVDRISFAPQRLNDYGVWRYEASLTASGTYGELKRLLADIQNLEGLFCIESLSLSREKPDGPIGMKARIGLYLTEDPTGS